MRLHNGYRSAEMQQNINTHGVLQIRLNLQFLCSGELQIRRNGTFAPERNPEPSRRPTLCNQLIYNIVQNNIMLKSL